MSGDTFHGSAVTTYTDGRAMLDPVNDHVAPDIYVPGNWDYSNEAAEDGNFVELMDDLDAPILANNLYDWETDERLYDAYRILDIGGLSVGVVGMTNVYVDRMAPAFSEGSTASVNTPHSSRSPHRPPARTARTSWSRSPRSASRGWSKPPRTVRAWT